MLKRILQLSACLMIMVLTLSSAQANLTDADIEIRSCKDLPLGQRPACCKTELEQCINKIQDRSISPAFACCKKCMWGTITYNFSYSDSKDRIPMKECQGGRD